MNVPSWQFLMFSALASVAINLSPKVAWRRAVLLMANVAFLASFAHDPRRLLPFGLLLASGYGILRMMEVRKNAAAFASGLVALLAAFFWLKQYAFVPHALTLPFAYATVGMSYVFFRILSLVIDAYQEPETRRVGIVSYLNYTLAFTALVSGPIQLYADYRRTEEVPAPLDDAVAWRAIERIVTGFFKVFVLSPLLGHVQAVTIASTSSALGFADRAGHAALLVAVFPLYLYFNFSGYCDVVIGVARFLRLELPENFNRPFSSTGFIEFWNRWHMTLSGWLKTYLYTPLVVALMRRVPSRAAEPWIGVFAYFVTFFVIGLWHGQTAAFALYGVLLGLGVSVNKAYQILMIRRLGRDRYGALCANPAYASVSRALTFAWYGIALLWFWSTFEQIFGLARALGPLAVIAGLLFLVALAAPVLSLYDRLPAWLDRVRPSSVPLLRSPQVRTAWAATLAMVLVSAEIALRAPPPQIVYRGF